MFFLTPVATAVVIVAVCTIVLVRRDRRRMGAVRQTSVSH